ncbi:hypothetical protein [Actinokineospora sp.]|uniref:hypothetical protein n=1 Tax=Actinokineospora sp. TaxID=1872133 RepID=UPI003D6C018D
MDQELTFVPLGPDGTVTITWTPQASGFYDLEVYSVLADGTVEYWNGRHYEFKVA